MADAPRGQSTGHMGENQEFFSTVSDRCVASRGYDRTPFPHYFF